MKQDKQSQPAREAGGSNLENISIGATRYIGSLPSLILLTFFVVGIFSLSVFGFTFDQIMLILTTAVSLEAIYLSIFIQMTVNRQSEQIAEVSEDVEEISEDVEEISKDIDDIQEDVEEISEEIEEEEREEAAEHAKGVEKIERLEGILAELLQEVKTLKGKKR